MSHDPRLESDLEFIRTCVSLRLLGVADAESLKESVGGEGQVVAQIAVQQGFLTQSDVDIVQSLQRPMDVVPGYKIQDLIGKGGMGVVYRAEQLDLEKIVALKTILVSNVHDSTVIARFEREAKSLARLQHSNIVQALNFGKHQGRFYFAMEYVSGPTCEQALREVGVMPEGRVWSIARQVASGLTHALKQNIIHRDIKPANLLLQPPPDGSADGTEVVKIADFGLAIFADQDNEQLKLTTGDKLMGSPTYMSPEQFASQTVDFRSDMYSLGATAWHLLFGSPPFQGGSVGALYQQKTEKMVVDPSTLPVRLPENQMQLLADLLDPDPSLRPQSYGQLIDAIDALGVYQTSGPSTLSVSHHNSVASNHVNVQSVALSESSIVGEGRFRPAESGEMNETIEFTEGFVSSKAAWIKWAVAVAVLVGLVGTMLWDFGGATRGKRTHTRVIDTTPLFDGETLSGWDVGGSMVGAWKTAEAPDASTAIACTTRQGALTRRFAETPNLRISLFVWLQPGGGAVDIDFAMDPSDPSDVRASLRMSAESNQLGEKVSDFGALDVVVETEALPTFNDRYHVVHIERQPTDWYVFLEEEFIGTLPIERVGDGSAIRLVVHDGESATVIKPTVFFADVQLYDLRENDPTEP